jgi:hypothetical protein
MAEVDCSGPSWSSSLSVVPISAACIKGFSSETLSPTISGMRMVNSSRQPDLFAARPDPEGPEYTLPDGPPPADFTDRIRGELEGTLARVREAASLPWQDLTATTLAEMRFNSIAGWLPRDEANALRTGFQIEMTRLYAIAAEQYERAQGAEGENPR